MFEELLSSESSGDSDFLSMIRYARSFCQKGDYASAWWILHAFTLGGHASEQRKERVIPKIGCLKVEVERMLGRR